MNFVTPFLRAMRATVPKQGAINGVQYFISTISGRSRFSRRPRRTQFTGLTVFITRSICKSAGGGVATNWLLPGKSNEGYCTEKV